MKIESFREEYFFLSNFYPCDVTINGTTYKSVEAAFQAQKCVDEEEKAKFVDMTPGQAKKYGKKVKLREDWKTVKVSIMKNIIRAKFNQNSMLKLKLLNTINCELVEGNTWRDCFWGVCKGKGKNMLGNILMEVRDEISEHIKEMAHKELHKSGGE